MGTQSTDFNWILEARLLVSHVSQFRPAKQPLMFVLHIENDRMVGKANNVLTTGPILKIEMHHNRRRTAYHIFARFMPCNSIKIEQENSCVSRFVKDACKCNLSKLHPTTQPEPAMKA
ncbi:hypothetical protein HELRODRAFT_174001 [Helobdella robusta]|uniref:Uncharacterized protein n=1 Tax=Helobdella robusta TaxID=6412 RepID=T1F7G7_HELRO|nr:hypothetical protein HELRODRAFT_174001 [Helobdella robusta]ESO03113.1 hypothetical protein HELRODRAFT_174001 [Helobdella robusta]